MAGRDPADQLPDDLPDDQHSRRLYERHGQAVAWEEFVFLYRDRGFATLDDAAVAFEQDGAGGLLAAVP